jgi:hypothetical protein
MISSKGNIAFVSYPAQLCARAFNRVGRALPASLSLILYRMSLLPPFQPRKTLPRNEIKSFKKGVSGSFRLFGDFDTTSGAKSLLEITVDSKLASSKSTNHEETSTETRERTTETELTADLEETGHGTLTRSTLGLVDLGKHGIGRLGDDGGGHTGDETGTKVGNSLHAAGEILLGVAAEDSLGNLLEDDELGHGVGDLLEADGTETSVESTDTLVLQHLGETTDKTVGVGGLRDETDTGGLERAEGDISEELGGGGRGEVDTSAVVGGILDTDVVDELLLEEFVSTELQGALEEITGEGRAGTSEESTGTLILDDLAETTDQTAVVGSGVELDASLDDVDGSQSTVGDGAADGTSEGEARVQGQTLGLGRVSGLDLLDDGINLGGHCDCGRN